jgi:hypothetical protein
MNQNRVWMFAALLTVPAFAAPPSSISTFDLFTGSEVVSWNTVRPVSSRDLPTRELREDGVPSCHAIPDVATLTAENPQIKILAPTLDKPLSAPLDIDLQFVPAGAVSIRPESFRVCYMGFLTIDITKRITDRVTVSAQGLHVSGAQLPPGHHHLMMLIADQQGHFGRREATFDIH